MRAFVLSRLPASTPQRTPGLSTERGSVDRGVGRAVTIGRMTLDLALDHLAQAHAELTAPDADPRAGLLATRVTLRDVDQMLADLMAA